MAMIPLDWRIRRIAELVATFQDDHGRNPAFLHLGREDYHEFCSLANRFGIVSYGPYGQELVGGLMVRRERTPRCFLVQ